MNDRHQNRGRWTEQGQDGGHYDAARDQTRDWSVDRSHDRDGSYARRQDRYDQDQTDRRSYAQSAQSNWGGNYGQPAFGGGDQWNTRSGAGRPGDDYGQAETGPSGYGRDRSQGRDPGAWSQGGGYRQSSGQSYSGGAQDFSRREPWRNASRPQQPSHHDFEPDYLHWRDQQMSQFDRDYHDWRSEKRQKFSSEFDTWRTSRGPAVQAENSVVGDVTDGGGGSQTHAKAVHGGDPKH